MTGEAYPPLFFKMRNYVKISSTLRKYVPGYAPEKGLDVQLPDEPPLRAADLAARLNLPLEEIKFVMINGRAVKMDTVLAPDDRVAFFPAVGGG